MEQLDRIARQVPTARLMKLTDCGHAPQRDQPEAVMQAIAELIARVGVGPIEPP
jgi:pimeloyl-ACP methyl ester carboxylesterase